MLLDGHEKDQQAVRCKCCRPTSRKDATAYPKGYCLLGPLVECPAHARSHAYFCSPTCGCSSGCVMTAAPGFPVLAWPSSRTEICLSIQEGGTLFFWKARVNFGLNPSDSLSPPPSPASSATTRTMG
eukprot:scaffold48182_cov19-Tisochrysis_lutea.AAC.2